MGVMDESQVPSDEDLQALVGDDLAGWAVDGRGRVCDLSAPVLPHHEGPAGIRVVPVDDVGSVLGRRVVCMRHDGPIRDLRAASEVFTEPPIGGMSGPRMIQVVEEWRWYAWQLDRQPGRPDRCPCTAAWYAANVYVETEDGAEGFRTSIPWRRDG